jgi:calmodulin
MQSFRVFDTEGTGVISIADLRFILTQLGDKMSNEEVDAVVLDCNSDGSGFIKYQPYIKEKLEKLEKAPKK